MLVIGLESDYIMFCGGIVMTTQYLYRLSSTLIDNIFTSNVVNKLIACILNIHINDYEPSSAYGRLSVS